MWSLVAALLMSACSSPPPAQPTPAARAKAAKGKTASKMKGKSKAKAPPPIGVAGDVTGVLTLAPVAAPTPPAAPAPAEGTPDAAPAPAPAAPAAPAKTEAKLVLTFADGTETPLTLGKVDGTCTEKTPVPIGPEGMQQTPLWMVSCTDAAGKSSELAIAQVSDQLTVLKALTAPTGKVDYKPIKRIKLAAGATVKKKV